MKKIKNKSKNVDSYKKSKNGSDLEFFAITGASSGIGEATAYQLAEQKKPLLLMARRADRLKEIQKKCLSLGSPQVLVFSLDIQSLKSIQQVAKKILSKKLGLRGLVNCAGLAKGVELVSDAKINDWEQMIDTNIKGLLYTTREFLPFLIASRGHIVNLGSVAGRIVYEGGAIYCATKFAVRAFSDGLRMDLKGTGVRVTNIEPGMVNTEFSFVRLGSQQKADSVYHDMEPLTANDIANSILWCLNQPLHVNVSELVIYPTDQASVGQVVRGEKSIRNLKN